MIQIKSCLLPLIGLSCNNCAFAIEKFVQKLPGVHEAGVDFAREKLSLTFDPAIVNETQIIEAVRRIGYDIAIARAELHTLTKLKEGGAPFLFVMAKLTILNKVLSLLSF